ncbi:hypothetical protein, partial [Tenacibaculum sp.]|uniref:hypothetical protein n=1 Tax=Tenacibaculum sp. TaxID=1906242 RepID=UPI003AA91ACC
PLIVGLLQGIGLDGVDILLLEYYPRGTGQDSTELVLKFGRAFSVFDGQPNTLGFYSALIILLVFLYKPFKSLTFSGAIILLALINLYFSESRGAALSLFITLFISFLINRDVKIIIQVMILTLVIAFLSFLVGADNIDLRIVDRFINAVYLSNSDGSSIYSARMLYWDELITKLTSLRYFLMGIPSSQLVALDNLYLFIFSYLGVFFGLIYILLIVYIMASRKIMNDRRLLCILVLFFVNGMSMPTLYIARVSETLWFIALFTLITAQMKSEVNEVSYENR